LNSNPLIQIASYSFPPEAHIAKASLEAAEIVAFITDEHTINMQWLYANAIGGVKLLVPSDRVDEAKALLQQDFSSSISGVVEEKDNLCCHCGSDKIEPYTRGKKPAFVVFLLLGFPLFFYQRGIKCLSCGRFTKQ